MFYLIVNPSSSSGYGTQTDEELMAVLRERGIAACAIRTEYAGHARKLAEEISREAKAAGRRDTLAVLGGDGTLNEILNGIEDFDSILLAVIPVGSGNDMARGLGLLPVPKEELFARIAEQKELRQMDICSVSFTENGTDRTHLFGVSAGIGFDAAVVEETNRSRVKSVLNKVHLGSLSYTAVAVKQILTAKESSCDLETEEMQLHLDRILFACAMNQPYEGGGFYFAPDSRSDDGKLGGLVIGDIPLVRELLAFPKAKKGQHYGIRGVRHFSAETIRVRTGNPLFIHTDGEIIGKADNAVFAYTGKKIALTV